MIKFVYCFILLSVFSQEEIFSQTKFIPFSDKHIVYEGRIPYAKDAAELTWPGTSVTINFNGTEISGTFKDQDTANYYNVIIDNNSIREIHFDTSKQTIILASGFPLGKHSIELFKRTEWDKGKTFFYGFEFSGKNELLNPSPLSKRKINFLATQSLWVRDQ